MNCVILQPSYIPWRGYFHQIRKADIFVFYDDVQYDKHGWRNRNRIKTRNGPAWLTIPVQSGGAVSQGRAIEYMVYDYPEYPQLYPPFEPQVSIIDLLLMTGPEAPRYIWQE